MFVLKSVKPTTYEGTEVPVYRSRDQIEELLMKVGARGFRWGRLVGEREELEAMIAIDGRSLAFRLSVNYTTDKEHRQRMRALYWYLKAKIEAILFGLVDLEQEFLPYLLVKGNQTVFQSVHEHLPLLTFWERRTRCPSDAGKENPDESDALWRVPPALRDREHPGARAAGSRDARGTEEPDRPLP